LHYVRSHGKNGIARHDEGLCILQARGGIIVGVTVTSAHSLKVA